MFHRKTFYIMDVKSKSIVDKSQIQQMRWPQIAKFFIIGNQVEIGEMQRQLSMLLGLPSSMPFAVTGGS